MSKWRMFSILLIVGMPTWANAAAASQTDTLTVKGLRFVFAKPDPKTWTFNGRGHLASWGILKFQSMDGSHLSLFYEDITADSTLGALALQSDSMSFFMDDEPVTVEVNDSVSEIGITTRHVPFCVSSWSDDSISVSPCARSRQVSGWYSAALERHGRRVVIMRQFVCSNVYFQILGDLSGKLPVEHLAEIHSILSSVRITTP